MTKDQMQLDSTWLDVIGDEFDKPYMKQLKKFLDSERDAGFTLFPPRDKIFNALNTTPFDKVRVVIIGQDPYHGVNQSHGLCFSVRDGVRFPPSLLNIYKEIAQEYDCEIPKTGDLTHWAEQGVLLLNATLTVRQAEAGSHQKKGWEEFTDAIIQAVNEKHERVVFLLWGAYAQKKGSIIDSEKHKVLKSVHPSPLSAHRGFFGCNHFKMTNEYLAAQGKDEIKWVL